MKLAESDLNSSFQSKGFQHNHKKYELYNDETYKFYNNKKLFCENIDQNLALKNVNLNNTDAWHELKLNESKQTCLSSEIKFDCSKRVLSENKNIMTGADHSTLVEMKPVKDYFQNNLHEMNSVERIWVNHGILGYAPAIVKSRCRDGSIMVQLEDSGESIIWTEKKLSHVHPSCLTGASDLLNLGQFDIGPILHTVRQRYFRDEIYTAIGFPILISVNPYRYISRLYSTETALKYRDFDYFKLREEKKKLIAGATNNNYHRNERKDFTQKIPVSGEQKSRKSLASLPPHLFRVAQTALNHLNQQGINQSIIISGESGAGKTEATKLILGYLAEISGMSCLNDMRYTKTKIPTECSNQDIATENFSRGFSVIQKTKMRGNHSSIETQITESNHLLESFGNAKTLRNDNSSRFGKFTQVHFNLKSNKLIGAKITSYLLEKSRIVTQQYDERNYHIFYQLCAGQPLLSTELQRKLCLFPAENFNYLNRCTRVLSINDTQSFEQLLLCFEEMKISTETVEEIFSLLAGILHLGNTNVLAVGNEEGKKNVEDYVSDIEEFNLTANLFGINAESLLTVLQYKHINDVNEHRKIAIPRTALEVSAAKDSISKGIYERLFQWLVMEVNNVLSVMFDSNTHENSHKVDHNHTEKEDFLNEKSSPIRQSTQNNYLFPLHKKPVQGSIGLLDIFGFEMFDINSFEQLCINFANEELQQHFNLHVFHEEQSLYEKEEIHWMHIRFEDNKKVLDALTNRVNGLFPMLDSECLVPKGTDQTFMSKVITAASVVDSFLILPGVKRNEQFGIQHYAGPVYYSPFGLIDKNRDRVYQDVFDCFVESKSFLLRKLFDEQKLLKQSRGLMVQENYSSDESILACNETRFPAKTQGFTQTSVSFTFRKQLSGLIRVLSMTTASYIRCIKPNAHKATLMFDSCDVLRQLKCAGILESIRIRKDGYPIRVDIRPFVMRYRVLIPKAKLKYISLVSHDALKAVAANMLESITVNYMNSNDPLKLPCGTEISIEDTKWMWQIGKSKIFLKDFFFQIIETQAEAAWADSVTVISRYWKGYVKKRDYKFTQQCVALLQSCCECVALHNKYINSIIAETEAAIQIQRTWRNYNARQIFIKQQSLIQEEQKNTINSRLLSQGFDEFEQNSVTAHNLQVYETPHMFVLQKEQTAGATSSDSVCSKGDDSSYLYSRQNEIASSKESFCNSIFSTFSNQLSQPKTNTFILPNPKKLTVNKKKKESNSQCSTAEYGSKREYDTQSLNNLTQGSVQKAVVQTLGEIIFEHMCQNSNRFNSSKAENKMSFANNESGEEMFKEFEPYKKLSEELKEKDKEINRLKNIMIGMSSKNEVSEKSNLFETQRCKELNAQLELKKEECKRMKRKYEKKLALIMKKQTDHNVVELEHKEHHFLNPQIELNTYRDNSKTLLNETDNNMCKVIRQESQQNYAHSPTLIAYQNIHENRLIGATCLCEREVIPKATCTDEVQRQKILIHARQYLKLIEDLQEDNIFLEDIKTEKEKKATICFALQELRRLFDLLVFSPKPFLFEENVCINGVPTKSIPGGLEIKKLKDLSTQTMSNKTRAYTQRDYRQNYNQFNNDPFGQAKTAFVTCTEHHPTEKSIYRGNSVVSCVTSRVKKNACRNYDMS